MSAVGTLTLKTWRDMKARKGQFAGLIVLVTLGVAVYVAFVGAALDLRASADLANETLPSPTSRPRSPRRRPASSRPCESTASPPSRAD